MDYQLTVPAIMRRAATMYANVAVVSCTGDGAIHRYHYGDMLRRARQLAVALQRLGVRGGDRVGTMAWNHHQHLEAYFAVPAIGAVLHTLNLRLHANDLAYIIEHGGDRVIIVDSSLVPLLSRIRLPHSVEHIVVMGEGELPPDAIEYEALVAGADPERFEEARPEEHKAAAMCYTSGTTGRPKGVVYSHRAIALQAMILTTADSIGIRRRDVVLAVVPMFHINGWCLPFAAALAGATLVLPGARLEPDALLRLIASERVTVSAGVPTVWLGVLHALDRAAGAHDVSTLRTLVIGGSAVPKALLRGYQERYGIKVMQAWGMTETTSIATVCTTPPELDDSTQEAQYAWRVKQGTAMPFVEIRARTDYGLAPWDGETMGELEVRGPAVATAYYNEPSASDRFTDDHWFRTGDVVTISPGGCIELRDRSKDLIRSGGEWISSVALENALMGHPAVAEAAVVAVPHPKWDERPLAVVVLKPGQQATEEELRAHIAPDFAKWWLPDRMEFIDEIPRTSTGKFLKSALRERFRMRYAQTLER
ncbi:MAG TPA: long-chain fatty acid--CoA ligase [Vicinamibacterales bacterium]|nr:long-chain fatty acid--CoA ligase [Vicinamibacterales bacterium]